jgi:hypothetical protein
MRRERFLIAVLWLSTWSLLALWFFNAVYSFNLFTAAHWQYLSELQLSGGVEQSFYISTGAFITGALAGLYVLIVPWHRKVKMRSSALGFYPSHAEPETKESEKPILSRPPKLNLDGGFMRRPASLSPAVSPSVSATPSAVPARVTPAPRRDASSPARGLEGWPPKSPGAVKEINRIFGQVGFFVKNPPKIGDVRLDFWAIAPEETLAVGLALDVNDEVMAAEGGDSMWVAGGRKFKSPVWQMSSVTQKLEGLFREVLDPELKVNMMPFVFINGHIANRDKVDVIWDALGISVIDDMASFVKFASGYGVLDVEGLDETRRGNFESFSDFANTVSSYFNGGA